jgi:mRNA interferase MazF
MRRGEVRWYTFAQPDKRRPVLLLTRDAVIDSLNEIIVVPATRTIRGIPTEVVLTPEDGMPVACALNFDHVALAQRSRLGVVLGTLPRLGGRRSSGRCSSPAASSRPAAERAGLLRAPAARWRVPGRAPDRRPAPQSRAL